MRFKCSSPEGDIFSLRVALFLLLLLLLLVCVSLLRLMTIMVLAYKADVERVGGGIFPFQAGDLPAHDAHAVAISVNCQQGS